MKKTGVKALIAMLVVASTMSGCGSDSSFSATAENIKAADSYSGSAKYSEKAEYAMDAATEEMYDMNDAADSLGALGSGENSSESSINSASNLEYEDKLVYEANLTIETLDFEKTYSDLAKLIADNGGRIESESYDAHFGSYTQNRKNIQGYYTTKQDYLVIRIPSKNYKSFVASDSELGNVIEKTQNLTNITQEYYSTTTRIELLEGQLEYYKYQLKLIEEKLMDCEDYEYVIQQMVELEDKIIYVQDQINQCTNSVKTMDMQVSYSTIYLTLTEVKEYSDSTDIVEEPEDTFLSRLLDNLSQSGKGFLRFLEGLLTMLIYVVPYVIVIGLIVFGIVKLVLLIIKLCSKKNPDKAIKTKKEDAKKEIIKENETEENE